MKIRVEYGIIGDGSQILTNQNSENSDFSILIIVEIWGPPQSPIIPHSVAHFIAHIISSDLLFQKFAESIVFYTSNIVSSRVLNYSNTTNRNIIQYQVGRLRFNKFVTVLLNFQLQDEDMRLEELEEKSKPYPYLSHALQSLPPDLGIMLEVKANLPEQV